MPLNKSQHFVPQHYLRNFRIEGTKSISAAKIEPFQFIRSTSINTQCKEDYFYKEDGQLDELLQQSENDLAPVLAKVIQNRNFNTKELVALRLLAVILKIRTRKSIEIAKIKPRRVGYKIIKDAIENGRIPYPKNDWKEEMMDFSGMAEALFKASAIPCWLEMQTLSCKLLEPTKDEFFITSDNPVVILNQYFSQKDPSRSFAGFSRSGFQLLLPISPHLCLFFYDPKIYKVGERKKHLISLNKSDTELINSLQIQSAEKCLYSSNPINHNQIRYLVDKFSSLREPIKNSLSEYTSGKPNETLLYFRQPSGRLKQPWKFCSYKRHPNIGPDNRRNAMWTHFVCMITEDQAKNPDRNVFESIEAILGCSLMDTPLLR